MKRIASIIGIVCVIAIIVAGIILYMPQPMLDFCGTVTSIETADGIVTFYIETPSIGTAYTVKADSKTSVKPRFREDPAVTLADITVGCTIEGDYRFGDTLLAKRIILWYK